MAVMDRRVYVAQATRSGDWWAIAVPDVPGVHSQARRLDQVGPMAREAIALILDVPEGSFDVQVRAELDPQMRRLVEVALAARRGAEEATHRASSAMDAAVRGLIGEGFILRDAGALLDVSYQRVQQIVERASRSVRDATHTPA